MTVARSISSPQSRRQSVGRPFAWAVAFIASTILTVAIPADHPRAEAPTERKIGCFPDNKSADPAGPRGRDLDGAAFNNSAMTVKLCVSLCSDIGFKYAGLQNGSWCFCGNKYGRYGGGASCTTKCSGNTEQLCGGEWSNSVWQVPDPQSAIAPKAVPTLDRPVPPPTDKPVANPTDRPVAPPTDKPVATPADRPVALPPAGGHKIKRFPKPKLSGFRLDSRPARGRGPDVVGVAHAYCKSKGYARMVAYKVADAAQTIAIEDGAFFENPRGDYATYRYIICGP